MFRHRLGGLKTRLKQNLRRLGFPGPDSGNIAGDSILYPRDGISLIDGPQGPLLQDRDNRALARLNQTGSLIWRLCDGNRSVDKIARLIVDSYPGMEHRIRRDLYHSLLELSSAGALRVESAVDGVSLVVPCAAEDAVFVESLLASVNYQTLKPREVVIALSGLSPENARQWEKRWRAKLAAEVPLTVRDVQRSQTAAQNRQRGADVAISRIVSWFDSDDLQSAQRLQRIEQEFDKAYVNAVYHRYTCYDRSLGDEGIRYPAADVSAWMKGAEMMFHPAWVSVRSEVLRNVSWYDRNQTTSLDFARTVRDRYGESGIALLPDFLGCRVSTGIRNEHINSGRKLAFLERKLADFQAHGSEIARTTNTLFRIPGNPWSREFRNRICGHEPLTMRMLLDHALTLQPGAVIINSGAHVGDTCLVLAQHLIDSGREDIRVYAIDPNQSKLDFVQEAADLNGIFNLELIHAALSDHTGEAKEDMSSPHPGEWQIVEDVEDANVPMIKLDDEFAARQVGLIHLDVEGFEEKAILGAEIIIRNDFPIFMIEKKGDAAKTERLLEFGYVETWAEENNALLIKAPARTAAQADPIFYDFSKMDFVKRNPRST